MDIKNKRKKGGTETELVFTCANCRYSVLFYLIELESVLEVEVNVNVGCVLVLVYVLC
jgi:hypothetical protein